MDQAFENETRERAYAFWIAEGMRDGTAEHDWLRAEAIVRKQAVTPVAATAAAKPSKAKAKKAAPEAAPKAAAPRRGKSAGAAAIAATA